ncbi:MAG: dephospho-CoA kinase [Kiritimatiellae bacterium]|nr:dephospho-CoA kinase [Kiritimatiellia bacterium]MDD5522277.1 dephospho-CoA kinase [Kiritimatiellia bacterium]
MLKIAITGGIACGKSLVGSYFAEKGFAVCDADDLAHGLMVSGSDVFGRLVGLFGQKILGNDGEIDRQRLGAMVFSNQEKLSLLNAAVHPDVKGLWNDWLRQKFEANCKAAVVIVPLLYETGEGRGWDAVVCVGASDATQAQRLRGRGLSDSDISRRIHVLLPVAEKMRLADYVILNDGRKSLLKQQTEIVIKHVIEKGKRQ